jgi:hypothetical protein
VALPPPIVPPAYPNVPPSPGVPPLFRQAGSVFAVAALLVVDAGAFLGVAPPPQWGIYYAGFPAIIGDTVMSFDFRQEYSVSDAPQEQGAFVSYNKVQNPFEGRVTFAKGGTIADRTQFLNRIAEAIASLDTGYSLVMPEMTWSSVNVTHQDFRRSRDAGANMLTIDVWVEQIRVTGTSSFTNTVNPSSQATQNGGQVQPLTPTSAQGGFIANAPGSPTAAQGGL